MTKAQTLSGNRKQLRQRLTEARNVLNASLRASFGKGTFDFENKRLVGDNGVILQWRLRDHPDQPPSYQNQQTSRGTVVVVIR
jgi:hypothetical protein